MQVEIKTCDPSSGFELCIYPAETRRKRSEWILWVSKDGSAQLFIGRDEDGAVKGEPIMLPANVTRAARHSKSKKIK